MPLRITTSAAWSTTHPASRVVPIGSCRWHNKRPITAKTRNLLTALMMQSDNLDPVCYLHSFQLENHIDPVPDNLDPVWNLHLFQLENHIDPVSDNLDPVCYLHSFQLENHIDPVSDNLDPVWNLHLFQLEIKFVIEQKVLQIFFEKVLSNSKIKLGGLLVRL